MEKSLLPAKRNVGIDALRLYAMFLVVVLHVLGHGGILATAQSEQYAISWFLEVIAYCAVDCYAIVSGYVSYSETEKPYHYSKYIMMWLQVVTYSFGITLIFFCLNPETVGLKTLIKSALPVTTSHYWYFSAYTGLFFIIPWINSFIRRHTKRELTIILIGIIGIFSGYGNIAMYVGDPFGLKNGYSFIWLTVLYILGAWMKKCAIPEKVKVGHAILGGLSCIIVTWLSFLLLPFNKLFLISYLSPTIIFIAAAYVIVFSKIQYSVPVQKMISCFAPASFGVYLIHTQNIIREEFMVDCFIWIAEASAWRLPVLVILCAGSIFVVCLMIEKVRLVFFQALKIDAFTQKVFIWIQNKILIWMSKLANTSMKF